MASTTPTVVVQRVTKASSDQLLSKFAELDSKAPPSLSSSRKTQLAKASPAAGALRRKRSRRVASGLGARDIIAASGSDSPSARRRRSGGLAEWKSLLPPPSPNFIRTEEETAGLGFLLAALEKTWRKTVRGASRMFIEKHCNTTHVRLVSEVV